MKEKLAGLARFARFAGPVGYPLFYAFCLGVFALLTFPYDELKARIVASFDADQPASGGQELQIDEMTGYWLTGVAVKGVTLVRAPSAPGRPPSKIVVDEATARYAILPALVGDTSVSFDAEVFGGEVSGTYGADGKDRTIDATLDSIDMSKVAPLGDLLGVPLGGKLGGTVRLTFPEGKASKAAGSVSLEAQGAFVGDGKAKIKGAMALPKVDVGALAFAAEAKDGLLKVTKFSAAGRDVDVHGDGRISLRDDASESIVDMLVRFRVNDAYRAKNDLTKSLFGEPGSSVPGLFELADPRIKQSKRADGFYGWSVRGAVSRVDFFPAGGGAAASPR